MIAIIPARCGSKGFKSKNIQELKGIPLIGHSINFAKKLSFISKIYVLTDSPQYAKLAIQLGAEIPYLRKENSSNDLSMEEDILEELRLNNIVD